VIQKIAVYAFRAARFRGFGTICIHSSVTFLAAGLSLHSELILPDAAQRAFPFFRQIFKRGAGFDVLIRISDFRVVNVAAYVAYILFHGIILLTFIVWYSLG